MSAAPNGLTFVVGAAASFGAWMLIHAIANTARLIHHRRKGFRAARLAAASRGGER